MIVLITGTSHTGKTALAQKHGVNYLLIDDKYEIKIDLENHNFNKETGI